LGETHSLTLTAHFTSRASALLSLLVEYTSLGTADTVLTVVGDPAFVAGAVGSLVLGETTGSVPRADLSIIIIHHLAIFNALLIAARTLTLAVGSNKPDITLADPNSSLACGLDEALTISTTDLTLEHWACHMAGLASKRLLAFTASAVGHLLIVLDTCATIGATTGQIGVWVHGATVGASLSHVRLVAAACACALLGIDLACTISIAWPACFINAWA